MAAGEKNKRNWREKQPLSKLKRWSMSQEILNFLLILSIENDIEKKNVENVIKIFTDLKARKFYFR